MEQRYKAQSTDWKSINILFPLILAIVFVAIGIYIQINEDVAIAGLGPEEIRKPILIGGLIIVGVLTIIGLLTQGKTTYTITNEGLRISKPFFHKRLFRFSDIQNIEKLDNSQAQQIVEEIQWKLEDMKKRRFEQRIPNMDYLKEEMEFRMERANLYMYSSGETRVFSRGGSRTSVRALGFDVYRKYKKSSEVKATVKGTFVLLTVNDNGAKRFFLTPEKVDEFVNNIKARIK